MAKELFEFESIRYPTLMVWDPEANKPAAQFAPDQDAEPAGDPNSGVISKPGRFETEDLKIATKVAMAEGVKGANKAAKDLIAKLKAPPVKPGKAEATE